MILPTKSGHPAKRVKANAQLAKSDLQIEQSAEIAKLKKALANLDEEVTILKSFSVHC